MYMNSAELSPCSFLHTRPSKKRHNVRVRRLNRRRRLSKESNRKKVGLKAEMELKNLRLYKENQTIIKENEKLRKKALLLHQENQALLSQLEKKFPCYSPNRSAHNHNH